MYIDLDYWTKSLVVRQWRLPAHQSQYCAALRIYSNIRISIWVFLMMPGSQFCTHLVKANISFEEISDGEVALGQSRIGGYKVIIVPELVDLPAFSSFTALDQYQKAGGKIMISDAGGIPEDGAKKLELIAGVNVFKQIDELPKNVSLGWLNGQEKVVSDEFPIGAVFAAFNPICRQFNSGALAES